VSDGKGRVAVAVLVDFQKVRDDDQEVEYIFGYPEMDRHLVIDKQTLKGRSPDGPEDRSYAAVFVKIIRYHRSAERWPEKGSYAA
jgi:hypothetical protein